MKDALSFVEEYFPQYYEQFKSVKPLICKCDILRFMVIYIHGGIYVDLDFDCRRNLDMLISDKKEIFIEELPEHEPRFRQLCNGCFASIKHTNFIRGWIYKMFINCKTLPAADVMDKTGPVAFWKYYAEFDSKPELGNTCDMTPYTNTRILSKLCLNNVDEYMSTYWNEGTNWGGPDSSEQSYMYITAIVILFILILGLLVYFGV